VNILGVTDPEWYGVRRALSAITPHYATPLEAIRRIEHEKPDVVVFGCYTHEWMETLKTARHNKCKTVLTWYASYVLNEFNAINRKWMVEALSAYRAGDFEFVATPHVGLADSWTHFGIPTDVLPPVVNVSALKGAKGGRRVDGVDIGVFGSAQPWKNMDCQLVAAAMVPSARIHAHRVIDTRLIDTLKIPLRRYGHVSDQEFYALLQSMHVNLCVTMSESFSYLVAESLLLGTPVVTTSITPILRSAAPPILRACTTPYFDDPMSIVSRVRFVLDDYHEIAEAGRAYMMELNAENEMIAADVIGRWG
jgi:glycosyltransferase involved in cell wall biosynthesis